MTEVSFTVLAFLVLAWALVSRPLSRANVTGPMVFLLAGYLLANPDWGPVEVEVEAESVHLLAEVTLALVLFSDASRIDVTRLRTDTGVPLRLLGIGLPLSMVLGGGLALVLLDDPAWALAVFVGASLAPTDAALSVQVIDDERVPLRVRRALNVESGINDGIATPVVVFALAAAAGTVDGAGETISDAVGELVLGLVIGVTVGFGGARLLVLSSRRGWILAGGQRLATLAVAVGSFALALALGGNGFIAAFVAGISFGAGLVREVVDVDRAGELPELGGELLALAVWFLFGAALVPLAFHHLDVRLAAYALLSLTVVRLLPVALALLGAGLDTRTVGFVGWFGPRGLASVVFALLAIEELGETEALGEAVAAVALTVLLSVLLHGTTAGPLGRRYARFEAAATDGPAPGQPPRSRGLQMR
jgi:sodium/hydrogen antiporter